MRFHRRRGKKAKNWLVVVPYRIVYTSHLFRHSPVSPRRAGVEPPNIQTSWSLPLNINRRAMPFSRNLPSSPDVGGVIDRCTIHAPTTSVILSKVLSPATPAVQRRITWRSPDRIGSNDPLQCHAYGSVLMRYHSVWCQRKEVAKKLVEPPSPQNPRHPRQVPPQHIQDFALCLPCSAIF